MSKAADDTALAVFTPSGKRGRFPHDTPLLQAARSLGVDLDSVCGGRGLCGRCQVIVSTGAFAKHGITSRADHVSPAGEVETRFDARRGLMPECRLGCQARLRGDVVIDVPPASQVHKQVVRKRAEVRAIELDPLVRLAYVEVEPPDMHTPSGDLERLQKALAAQWDFPDLRCEPTLLPILQKTLRQGDWKVTAAVHDQDRIIAIWPGFREHSCGVAIDIGSTTLAAHLCDLQSGEVLASTGLMNPQIRFGEDLMSRVSYAMMNPGGATEMTDAVRAAIDTLVTEVAAEAGIEPNDILELTFVGNPVMHHLLLGIDPVELGGAPFALASDQAISLAAQELDVSAAHPNAQAYVLPCIAGHVGADTAGVILSETPHLADEITLVVDVGTNAEIVLGNRARLLAASSPTGPAFEGAQISCGQRAAPGAIERVRIDPETLEPRFKIIGCDLWSNEPEFGAAAARLGVTGICGSGIIEALAEMYLTGILQSDGTIDGAKAEASARIAPDGRTFSYLIHAGEPEIRILQTDVRAIQLAKAALYAGARLLMDHLGVDQVDRIRLAGAFGSHIDVKYAMVLGLIPDCHLAHVSAAGNAAGTGARIALLNRAARKEIEGVVRRIEKIETAIEPRFQEHFVGAMAIPHRDAPYPNLTKLVDLPRPTKTEAREPRRRRRRSA